jgi:uncharacterized repeat protein (TIGR02543 family)
MKKKSRYILNFAGCLSLILLLAPAMIAQAKSVYQSPYVTFSPDGQAFTTNYMDKNWEHYPNGMTINTGITSSVRSLLTGEHYYKEERSGTAPIGKWVVRFQYAQCIHKDYPPIQEGFHGVTFGRLWHLEYYYSGWNAYCADCGDMLENPHIYMSDDAARSITELDLNLDYYYLCPFCTNLEQGSKLGKHWCRAISWNRYKVEYEINAFDGGGFMPDSIHMYNNQTIYEGKEITPSTCLTKNTYRRTGYEFTGWNTKSDGSGQWYSDGQEIFNLTTENYENGISGLVTLYAQWKKSESTLQINPNGGLFEGSSDTRSFKNEFLSKKTIDESKITPPKGHTVYFNVGGGKAVSPITGTTSFKEWKLSNPFHGDLYNGIYTYLGGDGTTDTITALYTPNSITLPSATKTGSSFGGWYYDQGCSNPAGAAGEKFTPTADITLYAKWVDLRLTSVDNYEANGGKGAVDLAWEQNDGNQKTYKLYQSTDRVNWLQIGGTSDIKSSLNANQTKNYSGKTGSYTIPYTGLYTLTAQGAQGGNYGLYTGGLGGKAMGSFWLSAGEEITYEVGGQNGYNGGGVASKYGNGGGATTVSTDLKGTILIAGGGGGATELGNGGNGGSSQSTIGEGEGEDGAAGGGAGYSGGKSGVVNIHHHTAECYPTLEDEIVIGTRSGNRSAWTNLHLANNATYWKEDAYNDELTINSSFARFYMHTRTGGKMNITLGETTPIPTNGRETMHMTIYMYAWGGDGWGTDSFYYEGLEGPNNAVKLYDGETGAEIPITIVNDGSKEILTDGSSDNSGNIIIKADVKGHNYVRLWAQIEKEGSWIEINVNEIYFEGGPSSVPYCGYEEGEILSANPAYGGSNYIHESYARSREEAAGQRSGDGQFTITSKQIGYLDLESLSGVTATDQALPDAVSDQSISKTALSEDTVILAWKEPEDHGTVYYHRAESYLTESSSILSESNTTKNTLTSGIKGYYYVYNTRAVTNVSQSNGKYREKKTNPSLTLLLTNEWQYLHLAATDKAGNISKTIHIPIGRIDPDVAWELITDQILLDPGDNIHPADETDTFYVKSDGETPFSMHFNSQMKGSATKEYQINYSIFRSQVTANSEEQKFIIRTPSHEVSSNTITTTGQNLQKSQEGSPILLDDAYTVTTRTNTCKDMATEQRFMLPLSFHGKKIQVTPIAGADFQDEQIYSKWEKDVQNSIYLIGDGEAPIVSGDEVLENLPLIDRRTKEITLILSAEDDLSGVKDFFVEISNTDNATIKRYMPEDDGKIRITITQDEPIFSGDFTIIITTTDQVGNVGVTTYDTTEFSLFTDVTRILAPHKPVFKCGESGILKIITYGYADRVEVEFPAEMTALNPDLNKIYHYEETPSYRQEENLQFMIPLYTQENMTFTITVKAYKGDKQLEDHPSVSVIGVEGSVLGEIRTRLR